MQPEAREQLALQSYLKQIEQPQVAFSVRQRRPTTLDDAVTATLEMESYVSPQRPSVQSVSTSEGPRPDSEDPTPTETVTPVAATSSDQTAKLAVVMEKLVERVQTLERQQSTSATRKEGRPSVSGRRQRQSTGPIICWNCQGRGTLPAIAANLSRRRETNYPRWREPFVGGCNVH